jgi:hypothetical protein
MSKTSEESSPVTSETALAHVMASSSPRTPVAAFACPALIKIALEVDFTSNCFLQNCTGAAHTAFSVNTPAHEHDSSATIKAQSALVPEFLKPAL